MTRRKAAPLVVAAFVLAAAAVALSWPHGTTLTLTGIVTTHEVIVSPQVAGRLDKLAVREGDTVTRGQVLAVIEPSELAADRAYYAKTAEGLSAQVAQGEAALRFEARGTAQQIAQAEAGLAQAEAELAEARANLEDARLLFERQEALVKDGTTAVQDRDHAKAVFEAARARVLATERQAQARRAALGLAQANAEQVAARRSAVAAAEAQRAAADAQRTRADVRLGYTTITAPLAGLVDVRAARLGEYVSPGQAVVTLIDPDDLWVRFDVEETYIDRIKLGDAFTVRLPSGATRTGKVVFRGVDAGFATQRDVSRTKRDIRTFEVRLAVDNRDRALAVGMTAYVLVPVAG